MELLANLALGFDTAFTLTNQSDPLRTLVRIIRYRDRKTRYYFWELTLLVIGLVSYVASVAAYLLAGTG